MDTRELGNLGERLACEYLVKNGYKIMGKNCRVNFGEIDIIAKKFTPLNKIFQILTFAFWQKLFNGEMDWFANKTIHFVEVKTLSGNSGFYPEEHVDYKKENKYRRLVEIWLDKNKLSQNYPCQVDVIAVSVNSAEPKIDFFENIVSDR